MLIKPNIKIMQKCKLSIPNTIRCNNGLDYNMWVAAMVDKFPCFSFPFKFIKWHSFSHIYPCYHFAIIIECIMLVVLPGYW